MTEYHIPGDKVHLPVPHQFFDEYATYTRVKGNLHYVPFRTVDQYLVQLQIIAETVSFELRTRPIIPIYFLAAAVSDFYIPPNQMAEHKIQSGNGKLTLVMDPVPKMLGRLVHEWAPLSFVVSFKLETDASMVLTKARQAIQKYGVHLVVANQLQVRSLNR